MKLLNLSEVESVSGGMTEGQCMAAFGLGGTAIGAGAGVVGGFFTGGIAWGFVDATATIGGVVGTTVGYLVCTE